MSIIMDLSIIQTATSETFQAIDGQLAIFIWYTTESLTVKTVTFGPIIFT